VKYNAGKYPGSYQLFGKYPYKDIEHRETECMDMTEKLSEIISTYMKYDLRSTHLSVHLDYFADTTFFFWLYIIPEEDKCLIVIGTGDHLVPDEKTFKSFVNLCIETFIEFDFAYGGFRDEYEGYIPFDTDEFLKEGPNIVNFYSREVADKIGLNKLLTTPGTDVKLLENGGVMLQVCNKSAGCLNELEKARHHLGYS
jgi:hypothetical protein